LGSFFRREKKAASAEAERVVWRPYEDRPLNLSAPQRGETADGQRALVLGFAALAVAGTAYFGTVMLTHEADKGVSIFSEADAATKPAEPAAVPADKTVRANTAGEAVAAVEPPTVQPKPQAAAKAQPKPAVQKAVVANDNPLIPIPVKVTTISIPAKPAAARAIATAPAPAEETRDQANARWAKLAAEAQPVVIDPNAYTEETKRMVSEGVEAVLREVTSEKPSKKPVVVASAEAGAGAVRDSEPEMAGNVPTTGRQARIRTSVNMRSGPADGSRVLGVIPSNSTVSLAPGCRHWCKVTYQGRTGYIYKSFLR